jgi:uncharacterized metal-binding protein
MGFCALCLMQDSRWFDSRLKLKSQERSSGTRIPKTRGFWVISAVCKSGRTSRDLIGIKNEEKIYQRTDEAMCNPVYQAKLMNDARTDFNVLLGLCVGHDSLFFKFAEAPTTVLAVKNRVMGHNLLAAIYLDETYYRKIAMP